jgi:PAS domain S-box-containing protein
VSPQDKVNILLVDDQPAKLMGYEVLLRDLGENLITASSAREAFEHLLKTDVAVILIDVCMPELDGFQLASMLREHPRFEKTSIIFVSAVLLAEPDLVRGYASGAVDYVSVPIVPEILRAKVRIFVDLYRKTRQLEKLNDELEQRVRERTAALEASNARLRESEERLRSASEAAGFGTYDYNAAAGRVYWSPYLREIVGVEEESPLTLETVLRYIHPDHRALVRQHVEGHAPNTDRREIEFKVIRPDGQVRWMLDRGQAVPDNESAQGGLRVTGTVLDITERKWAEERQQLLMAELDHRVKNTLANVSAIARLSRPHAGSVDSFVEALDGRIQAMSNAHGLLRHRSWTGAELSELVRALLTPFRSEASKNIILEGGTAYITPRAAQSFALVLHELATNAVKHGALSVPTGKVIASWKQIDRGAGQERQLEFVWRECGGPGAREPSKKGFGLTVLYSVASEFGGDIDCAFEPEGLVCTIRGEFIGRAERSIAGVRSHPEAVSVELCHQSVPPGDPLCRRILIVEDEPFVALQLQSDLESEGHQVVGPASNLAEGLELAQSEGFDAALVDVRLGRDTSASIADELLARRIPFAFATGYADTSMLPEHLRSVPRLKKPYALDDVRSVVRRLFAQQAAR